MYSLIRKSRSLMLPIDLQIELFEKTVQPILLYGSEVWGFENLDVLERVVLKYLKLILNMKTSTPNFIVYGETGVYPIYIDIYCRMISFCATLVSGPLTKLSYSKYLTGYSLYRFENNSNKFKWFHTIKDLLCSCGFSGVWDNHLFPIKKRLVSAVRQKLKDILITNWLSLVAKSSNGINYRISKTVFVLNNIWYLSQ